MARSSGVVWIAEDALSAESPGLLFDGEVYTGRFSGLHDDGGGGVAAEFEGLDAEAAIAWGRARAPRVLIRLVDGDYLSAGVDSPDDTPPWPPAEPIRRRRPRGEEWRDRDPGAAPIAWRVRVDLHALATDPPRARDGEVAEIAARAGAVSWRRHRVVTREAPNGEGAVADFPDGRVDLIGWAALDPEEGGDTSGRDARGEFVGWEPLGWTLWLAPTAATALEAMRTVLRACALPPDMSASALARPHAGDA